MTEKELRERICRELMEMADEREAELERWSKEHPEEIQELMRLHPPYFNRGGLADRGKVCYDKRRKKVRRRKK